MDEHQAMSCLICLEADEAGSMIFLELAAIGNYASRTFQLCRRCAARIATALAETGETPPEAKSNDRGSQLPLAAPANRPPRRDRLARMPSDLRDANKPPTAIDRSESQDSPVSTEPVAQSNVVDGGPAAGGESSSSEK